MMRTQREMKGQRSDMNLRAVEQEKARILKRQRTSKANGKQSFCCSDRLRSANYFDRTKRKSKQREWGGLSFWSVGHSCNRRWRNRTENCKGRRVRNHRVQISRYQTPNKDLFRHWRYSSLLHWATIYGNTNCCIRERLLTCHTANSEGRSTDFKSSLLYLWNLD